MSYSTYLFDFDYTLADSSRGIVTCFRLVLDRHGYSGITDEAIKRTIGKTLEESFSILTGVTDATRLESFKNEYRKEADTHMTINTVLFLETKSVLLALKDAGASIGIISTKYRFRIKELVDQHFPSNFFDIIVGGEDVKSAKPSPEGVLLALKELHASKAETLYIGDSTVDAATAKAAGVSFAGVTHGVTTAEELSKYPYWKIMNSLEELLTNNVPTKQNEPPTDEATGVSNTGYLAAPHEKKRVSIWQAMLLILLLWLSFEEEEESYIFLCTTLLFFWHLLTTRRMIPRRLSALISPWWLPVRIRLRSIHIKMIQGKQVPIAYEGSSTCLNCGTVYTGSYCNRCGQSRKVTRYRLSNAFKNILGGFTNIDNGFGRTLLDLLYRPGYMIKDFIAGKRVMYFRPFQTLFVLAALYIMVVQLVDPEALNSSTGSKQEAIDILELLQTEFDKKQTALQKDSIKLSDIAIRTDQEESSNTINRLIKNTLSTTDKIESSVQRYPFFQKVWNLLLSWAHGNKAFRIIATLPLFALATFMAFWSRKEKKRYNLTEHIFIQTYIACQVLLLSIVVLPFNGCAAVDELYELPLSMIFVLFCWDYKQLYRCTWWKSFWHTLLMFFYSLILLILFAVLVLGLVITFAYIAGVIL
ncbi:HAD-IA family hydrolase [uncultured Bacteroides sp.]|uniref:HAD-IA family hydrolase n=1 Tax=uncultured Bacteroides sp. TaxID=162156 RepID=UPI0025D33B49|nr:HAD-IA family hydrolase [uncultured Bacteroides sp.]